MSPLALRLGWCGAATLGTLLFAGDAAAIIGRPLTPVSVAGVARRTTRRTAVAVAATTPSTVVVEAPPPVQTAPPPAPPAPAAPAATPSSGAVTELPAGCTQTQGAAYQCGSTVYTPYYQGTNVVYVPSG